MDIQQLCELTVAFFLLVVIIISQTEQELRFHQDNIEFSYFKENPLYAILKWRSVFCCWIAMTSPFISKLKIHVVAINLTRYITRYVIQHVLLYRVVCFLTTSESLQSLFAEVDCFGVDASTIAMLIYV